MFDGVTVIDCRPATWTVAEVEPVIAASLAVMVALPVATPVSKPELAPTVAMVGSDVVQATVPVMFLLLPSS